MTSWISRLGATLFIGASAAGAAPVGIEDPIPYDLSIDLDAEDLAELGMAEAYERVRPEIERLGGAPETLREHVDETEGSYAIEYRGIVYPISGGEIGVADGWGTAAAVFFEIVNGQMEGTSYRLYAVNHGNDLSGVFLTDAQFEAASAFHGATEDAPFLPTRIGPWFGQPTGDRRSRGKRP